eukprot:1340347-Rhodomonas_salina.1
MSDIDLASSIGAASIERGTNTTLRCFATDLGYAATPYCAISVTSAIVLRFRYAMSGTESHFAATILVVLSDAEKGMLSVSFGLASAPGQ